MKQTTGKKKKEKRGKKGKTKKGKTKEKQGVPKRQNGPLKNEHFGPENAGNRPFICGFLGRAECLFWM